MIDTSIAPPHAQGVEKAVLSVLLRSPEAREEANLTTDHFYLAANRIVFDRITAEAGDIELVAFVQRMHDCGDLDLIGGPAAIYEIYTYAPNSAHLSDHVAILVEKMVRRKALALAQKLEKAAHEADTPAEIVDLTSGPVTEIHDLAAGNKPAASTVSVLHNVMTTFQAICEGKASPMGIETSLLEINRRFLGLHGGRAVVISGYPGGGKTTLGGQLAMDAALAEENTLIASLEMTAEDLMRRCVSYAARLPGDAIKDPIRYAREEWKAEKPTKQMLQQIGLAMRKISGLPFHIDNLVGANVYQIAAVIRRHHRKKPLKVVMVDFVQRIRPVPEKVRESKEQQLAHASNTLADLSKELGFCLLLPSQLNKDGAAKHAEAINEDADLHLQIVQDRRGDAPTYAHIGIGVAKDRHHGQTGETLPIVLDAPMLRFIPKPLDQN